MCAYTRIRLGQNLSGAFSCADSLTTVDWVSWWWQRLLGLDPWEKQKVQGRCYCLSSM